MTIGNKISECRKKKGMTQDALAQLLGVTNQAVSKWESDQSCPDVLLLPKIADIFEITVDELLGREVKQEKSGFEKVFGISLDELEEKGNRKKNSEQKVHGKLPWEDDGTLHAVLFRGHTLLRNSPVAKEITFKYEGEALNIDSAFSVHCGNVAGDVDAGTDVSCGSVGGDVDAGCNVCCENVYGDVDAGTNVKCGDVMGDVDAGTAVSCGNVGGSVDAGGSVECGNVDGDVDAGSYVECGSVGGDIDAGGPVTVRK